MCTVQSFYLNTGEIYIHENTNWQSILDLRKYMGEMETKILFLLRKNKIAAVTSETHNEEYFRTKREQFESNQLKALDENNPPFTYFFIDGGPDWKLYSYSEPYNISRAEEDQDVFEFFFAYKLRQIDLMEIDEFLAYHLITSYENIWTKYARFLDLIFRKYDILFDAAKLKTIKEWMSMNQSKKTEDDNTRIEDADRIEWQGSQKELAELFIELKRKGFIKEIDHNLITKAFTKSDTIQQILKPATDKHTLEDTYEQVYTKSYRPRFHHILKCK